MNVKNGGSYRCYLYGATAFQKAMSFGQTPHSDAVCNAVVGGQNRSGSKSPEAAGDRNSGGQCNALIKAGDFTVIIKCHHHRRRDNQAKTRI